MAIENELVLFWIIMGAMFGPVIVVGCFLSVVKIFVDRRRINRKNAAIRLAREQDSSGRTIRRTNIMIIEDEERANRIMAGGKSPTASTVQEDESNNAIDSYNDGEERKRRRPGGQNIKVTVEHNLNASNGLEVHRHGHHHGKTRDRRGSDQGIDNLGSSFSDVAEKSSKKGMAIEMDNLSSDNSENLVVTTPSDESSWQANTDVDTVSDSEMVDMLANGSPQKTVNSATRLLSHSQQHNHQDIKSQNRQHNQHRPQKPKRGGKEHHHSNNHIEKTYANGSLGKLNSSGENLASLNGIKVLVTSQSKDRDLDHCPRNSRRYSYAAALDIDCDLTDMSPSRSLSEDDLHRQTHLPHPYHDQSPCNGVNGGKTNKGFVRSTEGSFIEM